MQSIFKIHEHKKEKNIEMNGFVRFLQGFKVPVVYSHLFRKEESAQNS